MVSAPNGEIELHTTHIPPGVSNGWTKIEMLEGLYKRLARSSEDPRILCGDFNTPREESPDRVITWAQRVKKDRSVVLRKERGKRWDDGERNVLTGLAEFDLVDVFRRIHPHDFEAFSWKANNGRVRRFDHVFASARLNPVQCEYLQGPRKRGLSDHTPIEVVFNPR